MSPVPAGTRLRTARRVFADLGARGIAFVLLERLPGVHAEWLAVFEHPRPPADPPRVPGFRWADEGDAAALAGLGEAPSVLAARLRRGDLAATVAGPDGRPVAYAWYRRAGDRGPGLRFEIEPEAAWAYDLLVAPQRRGRGLAGRLLDRAEADLARAGVRRIVSTVDRVNRASLRVAAARGSACLGDVLALRLAGVTARREAWAGRRPRWSIDRGAGVVPVPRADGARPLARGLRGRPAAPR